MYFYWWVFCVLFSSFLIMGFLFVYFMFNKYVFMMEWELMELNSCSISMIVFLDWMSLSFMCFVLLISSMIVYYSMSYMGHDENKNLFLMMVMMFVMSMLFMIISPNLISILLGWDGLGLISYCLVIYYQSGKSYDAGMMTVLTNRIGDVMILMGIAWMINFGSWNFIWKMDYFSGVLFLMIVAGMTKSAQIPFSSWLPAAMAAPTPVSALVHSSTLVTAGVYLLIRFNGIFSNLFMKTGLLMLSVLTMFMAGLGAMFEYDLKKIIALSTLSQLGLMMSSLCMGLIKIGFFHLLSHALFKSLLFMCAGYMIHYGNNIQDIRYMGSYSLQLPMLSIIFVVSNLSLCGFPFLSGFYSKDLILDNMVFMNFNNLLYVLYFISTLLTVGYTFRMIYYVMIDEYKGGSFLMMNDDDYSMIMAMGMMFIWVIFGGSMMMWVIFTEGMNVYLSYTSKLMPLFMLMFGVSLGLMKSSFDNYGWIYSSLLLIFISSMWYLPFLSSYCLNGIFLKLGYLYYKLIDQGWLDYLGGQGLKSLMMKYSGKFYEVNLNKIDFYILLYLYVLFVMLFVFMII